MKNSDDGVAQHYTLGDLGQRILGALESAGKDMGALTVDDLAPVDEFHIRGRIATEELAQWADVEAHHLLLDVGCGVGGTSRYLAANKGCDVVGVDLTEEYCQITEMLSERVGLAGRTVFQQASALELPFDDGHFDVVWTEHVQMNIADKTRFYSEIARVLKRGAQFAFHDIFAGTNTELYLPVPWASDASISHLIDPDGLRALLADLPFEVVRWEDKTDESIAFFEAALKSGGGQPLGISLLMGDSAAEKLGNVLRNLRENRICVVQAVMKRTEVEHS